LNKGGAVDTCNAAAGLIRSAERIIYWQKWRICQERAAAHLAGTTSLHWTPLFPDSTVIQVVAMDGLVMGQVRQDGHRRVATSVGRRPHVAGYDTFSRIRAGPRARRAHAETEPENTTVTDGVSSFDAENS
jgi:hypothetical protein